MPDGREVFIVFGRDDDARNALRDIFTDFNIRTTLLVRSRRLGGLLPAELERVVRMCDAAVVLATPDDVGRLRNEKDDLPRARENVWIELGWFWAELGLARTLLITQESIHPPSDLSGVFRLTYQNSPSELRADIRDWLDSLDADRPDDSVDLLRSTIDTGLRNGEYQQIHSAAVRTLHVTGIGMINVRQDLPHLMSSLKQRPLVSTTFLVPSDRVLGLNATSLLTPYRSTRDDIDVFVRELKALVGLHHMVDRVRLLRYDKLMTFVATVADLGDRGSPMLVEFPLEADQHGLVERPRISLRRRVVGGVYDRFASALQGMLSEDNSKPEPLS